MREKKAARWIRMFLQSVQLHFFISCISLPFLIGWGLPISLMAPVSTMLFTPFLTVFLFLSSLMFFLELFYIPNGLLVWLLEHTTYIWNVALSYEQSSWLVTFKKPSFIVLLFIPLGALAVIHCKKIQSPIMQLTMLAIVFVTVCGLCKIAPYVYPQCMIETINCNPGKCTIISYNGVTTMIDEGFLSARPSCESIINYTLLPVLVQKTGSLLIDHLIVKKINARIFESLSYLAAKVIIKNTYMPSWKNKIPYRAWKQYRMVQESITLRGGKIVHCSTDNTGLKMLSDSVTLTVSPHHINYYDAVYNPLNVTIVAHNSTENCDKTQVV